MAMHKTLKSWLLTFLKSAIAVGGLGIAIWPPWKPEPVMTWDDRYTIHAGASINAVTFLDPVNVKVVEHLAAPPVAGNYVVVFPGRPLHVSVDGREQTVSLSDPAVGWPTLQKELPPAAFDLVDPLAAPGMPKDQVGLKRLIVDANKPLLLAAWAVLIIPFVVTAWRWRKLMEPQGIFLSNGKCLALTFVGQFYSTFLPGITGGDLVKIIYTSRVTGSKTKSTVTILLDRVIGLIALMVIAGSAAAVEFATTGNTTMHNVALLIGAALACLGLGCLVYFSHRLRKATGLTWLLNHDYVPDFVRHADEVLHAYRGAWRILAGAFAASLIAQITLPLSAMLAGKAFGMQAAHMGHFLAYTPLATLAASVPISPPQGFGVIEWVLFHFFANKGLASPSQTFAAAQAIRFLPILWNMVGAYWVVTGQYSRVDTTGAPRERAAPTCRAATVNRHCAVTAFT